MLHRILIKQDKLEDANKDYVKMRELGLVLAETEDRKRAQAGVDTGTVVAIGSTAFKDFGTTSPIVVGDKIAYARFSGKFVTDPATQEEFVALNDEDVICVFSEE
ncbi:MAG: co-chaperone GroES family protein [Candidatus Magasanikiibacteriota bacterium]